MCGQQQVRKVPIQTFIVVPEACPGGFELTCDCCEYAVMEFRLMKTPGRAAVPGFVECSYGAER